MLYLTRRKITWLTGSIISMIVAVVLVVAIHFFHATSDKAIGKNIKTVLSVTHASIDKWLNINKHITAYYANTAKIRNLTENLLKQPSGSYTEANRQLHAWYETVTSTQNYLGYYIVNQQGINVASYHDENIGSRSVLVSQTGLLNAVFSGATVSSQPLITKSTINTNDKSNGNESTIYTVAPVFDASHKVIAALALKMNLASEVGYFINAAASEKAMNIIALDRKLHFLNLGNNSGNLGQLPRNINAQISAVFDKESYSTERAVLIRQNVDDGMLGAALWDKHLGVGLFAYTDGDENYAAYQSATLIIIALALVVVGLIWLVLINTERAQAHLQKNKAWLQKLLDSIPSVISVVNKNGGMKFCNKHLEKLSGYRNKITGHNEFSMREGNGPGRFFENHMLNHVDGVWSVRCIAPDNVEHIINFEYLPFLDEEQQPVDLIVANDVTEYINIETENEKLLLQLQQSQKMEAIGQLTGGIAHDFNNMLAAIMGYTRLSLDYFSDGNEKLKEYLTEVERAGLHAQSLVKQMLTYSRQNGGAFNRVDTVSVLNDTLSLLKSTIPSSIEIIHKTPTQPVEIIINPVQLQQVIMNLVINSRDSISAKGMILCAVDTINITNVTCASCHEEFSGQFVAITVQDNGEGIEPIDKNKIFDPFYTNKELGKGTGMGLAMVHGIVHSAKGHIIVHSSPGLGTEIQLLFPVINMKTYDADKKSA